MDTAAIPVSVVMMTHRHENFIIHAVEGVLMQQYPGPVKLIIANDASPDNTHHRLKEFLQRDIPANFTIDYTRHSENLGMMTNFAWALSRATGKYTAFCEGDDYWTDPLKLRKQVDFLEANPKYSLVFSNTALLSDSPFTHADLDMQEVQVDREYRPDEIFDWWIIPFNTVMYRNTLKPEFFTMLRENRNLLFGDIVLYLYLAKQGKLYGMKERMAVYRRHPGNITLESASRDARNQFRHRRALVREFGSRYATPRIRLLLARYARETAWQYYTRGNTAYAIPYLYWALVYDFRATAGILWRGMKRLLK